MFVCLFCLSVLLVLYVCFVYCICVSLNQGPPEVAHASNVVCKVFVCIISFRFQKMQTYHRKSKNHYVQYLKAKKRTHEVQHGMGCWLGSRISRTAHKLQHDVPKTILEHVFKRAAQHVLTLPLKRKTTCRKYACFGHTSCFGVQ